MSAEPISIGLVSVDEDTIDSRDRQWLRIDMVNGRPVYYVGELEVSPEVYRDVLASNRLIEACALRDLLSSVVDLPDTRDHNFGEELLRALDGIGGAL